MKNRNNNNSGRAQMSGSRRGHRTNQKSQRKQSGGEMRSETDVGPDIENDDSGRERRE